MPDNQRIPTLPAFTHQFEARPNFAALKLGLLLSGATILLALCWLPLLSMLPDAARGPSAAAHLAGVHPAIFMLLAVVYAPVYETIVGQVLPIELLRRLGAHWLVCLLASALLFGGGHYLNGSLTHGLTTFITGLVLAYGYLTARPHGCWPACITTAVAHACHNGFLLLVVAPLAELLEHAI